MKIPMILITVFAVIITGLAEQSPIVNKPNVYNRGEIQACPEQEPFDWVAVNLVLTAGHLEEQRIKSRISNFIFDTVEFKTKHREVQTDPRTKEEVISYWKALGSYWNERGVKAVTETRICELIGEVIESDESIRRYQDTHTPRAYYRIKDKYLIIYKSRKPGTGRSPVVILDKDFEVAGSFGI